MKRLLLLALATVSCGVPAVQPARAAPEQTTRAAVLALMAEHHRPGAAIAVTRDGEVIWHDEYGVADLGTGEPVTKETVFAACSLSKVVTLVAVMNVVELLATKTGRSIDAVLDTDIDDLATPIHVRNPAWPNAPISLRMLLAHVSSVHDDYHLAPHHVAVKAPDYHYSGPDLESALVAYVTPGGATYRDENYLDARPGTATKYSSIGLAIPALMVSRRAEPFDRFTARTLFEPLAMKHTAWRIETLDAPHLAIPYQWRSSENRPVPPVVWENTFYPSASLRTTALDYARFVAALAGTNSSGSRLLSKPSMDEVLRAQYPAVDAKRGLVVGFTQRAGVDVVGHDGQNDGFRSSMFFTRPSAARPTYGVVILTNGDAEVDGLALEPKLGDEILRRAMGGRLSQ